jgi:hypothetical protein
MLGKWPLKIEGIVETIVTTQEESGLWNVAVVGLHGGDIITARTWGNTRTRKNFKERNEGYIQFIRDSVLFTEAALGIIEHKDPIIKGAYAWVKIKPISIETGHSRGTEWEDWEIKVEEYSILDKEIPIINRGYNSIVEATIIASRMDLSIEKEKDAQKIEELLEIAEKCGDVLEGEASLLIREFIRLKQ